MTGSGVSVAIGNWTRPREKRGSNCAACVHSLCSVRLCCVRCQTRRALTAHGRTRRLTLRASAVRPVVMPHDVAA